jgi:hypothetical protein
MEAEIVFCNTSLKRDYESLGERKEFKRLYDSLTCAFLEISRNPSAGTPLKKYRIPREFAASGFTNIWKYDLPGAWRLIYSLANEKIRILAIILDWCDHKTYQTRYSGKK